MKEVVTTCNYNNNLTETQKEPESSDSELNEKKQAFAHKLRITERNLFPNLSSASAPNLSPTSLPENKPLFSSPRRASNPTRPGIFSERTSKMNAQLATPSACNSDPPHRRQMTKVDSWNAHYWALTSMWANQTGSVTVRRPSATQIEPKTLANGFVEMKEQRANARLKSSPDSDGYNSSTCSSESAETVRQKKTAQRVGKRHRRRKSLDLLSSSFTRSMEDGNSSSSDELDSATAAHGSTAVGTFLRSHVTQSDVRDLRPRQRTRHKRMHKEKYHVAAYERCLVNAVVSKNIQPLREKHFQEVCAPSVQEFVKVEEKQHAYVYGNTEYAEIYLKEPQNCSEQLTEEEDGRYATYEECLQEFKKSEDDKYHQQALSTVEPQEDRATVLDQYVEIMETLADDHLSDEEIVWNDAGTLQEEQTEIQQSIQNMTNIGKDIEKTCKEIMQSVSGIFQIAEQIKNTSPRSASNAPSSTLDHLSSASDETSKRMESISSVDTEMLRLLKLGEELQSSGCQSRSRVSGERSPTAHSLLSSESLGIQNASLSCNSDCGQVFEKCFSLERPRWKWISPLGQKCRHRPESGASDQFLEEKLAVLAAQRPCLKGLSLLKPVWCQPERPRRTSLEEATKKVDEMLRQAKLRQKTTTFLNSNFHVKESEERKQFDLSSAANCSLVGQANAIINAFKKNSTIDTETSVVSSLSKDKMDYTRRWLEGDLKSFSSVKSNLPPLDAKYSNDADLQSVGSASAEVAAITDWKSSCKEAQLQNELVVWHRRKDSKENSTVDVFDNTITANPSYSCGKGGKAEFQFSPVKPISSSSSSESSFSNNDYHSTKSPKEYCFKTKNAADDFSAQSLPLGFCTPSCLPKRKGSAITTTPASTTPTVDVVIVAPWAKQLYIASESSSSRDSKPNKKQFKPAEQSKQKMNAIYDLVDELELNTEPSDPIRLHFPVNTSSEKLGNCSMANGEIALQSRRREKRTFKPFRRTSQGNFFHTHRDRLEISGQVNSANNLVHSVNGEPTLLNRMRVHDGKLPLSSFLRPWKAAAACSSTNQQASTAEIKDYDNLQVKRKESDKKLCPTRSEGHLTNSKLTNNLGSTTVRGAEGELWVKLLPKRSHLSSVTSNESRSIQSSVSLNSASSRHTPVAELLPSPKSQPLSSRSYRYLGSSASEAGGMVKLYDSSRFSKPVANAANSMPRHLIRTLLSKLKNSGNSSGRDLRTSNDSFRDVVSHSLVNVTNEAENHWYGMQEQHLSNTEFVEKKMIKIQLDNLLPWQQYSYSYPSSRATKSLSKTNQFKAAFSQFWKKRQLN
ncbi:hypothetical protein T4A_14241 [Trichinella pseudospiralis]|uniref:Uncharacterized protein n=2 Tax=Trichinella pseudospiralis TaxID=6337 RepID=A0A0V1E343_TRIPS|nr:hypothetical protein T4A_14241 [Trichinella pseudospiralis]